jgi:hypothetical protein
VDGGGYTTSLIFLNTSNATETGNFQIMDEDGAAFADGFVTGLPDGFTGVLDISSATAFAALTLRSLDNERGEFLMTTFPIADASQTAPMPIVFPHIVDGGGYVTQFVLISPAGESSTTLSFFDEEGEAWVVGE